MDTSARLSSTCSQCRLLCPSPQASTTEIRALWLCSSLTPRYIHSAHPRPQSTRGEHDLERLTNRTNLRHPAAAKTRTRSPKRGTQFSGFPHPSNHASIHPCMLACLHACMHTIQIGGQKSGEFFALLWAKSRRPLCSSLASCSTKAPSARGEQLNYERSKETKSRAPTPCPSELLQSPFLVPHPHCRKLGGRAGRRRCEGSCPAPREQSPPRELAAAL